MVTPYGELRRIGSHGASYTHRTVIVLGTISTQTIDVFEQATPSDGGGHFDLLAGHAAAPVMAGWGHP